MSIHLLLRLHVVPLILSESWSGHEQSLPQRPNWTAEQRVGVLHHPEDPGGGCLHRSRGVGHFRLRHPHAEHIQWVGTTGLLPAVCLV